MQYIMIAMKVQKMEFKFDGNEHSKLYPHVKFGNNDMNKIQ